MTLQPTRRWRSDFSSLVKVAVAMALLMFMGACTTVNVYAPTYNAPVTSQSWATPQTTSESKPRMDALAAAALSNATSEISLFGLDEERLISVAHCPVFTRPIFAPVPQIPLQQLSAMGEQDMSAKVDLITRYTRDLREWIVARREAFSKAYDLYLLECQPPDKNKPAPKKTATARRP